MNPWWRRPNAESSSSASEESSSRSSSRRSDNEERSGGSCDRLRKAAAFGREKAAKTHLAILTEALGEKRPETCHSETRRLVVQSLGKSRRVRRGQARDEISLGWEVMVHARIG